MVRKLTVTEVAQQPSWFFKCFLQTAHWITMNALHVAQPPQQPPCISSSVLVVPQQARAEDSFARLLSSTSVILR